MSNVFGYVPGKPSALDVDLSQTASGSNYLIMSSHASGLSELETSPAGATYNVSSNTASLNVNGNLTGNVTGNLTGGTVSATTGSFSSSVNVNGVLTLGGYVKSSVSAAELTTTSTLDPLYSFYLVNLTGGNRIFTLPDPADAAYAGASVTFRRIRTTWLFFIDCLGANGFPFYASNLYNATAGPITYNVNVLSMTFVCCNSYWCITEILYYNGN